MWRIFPSCCSRVSAPIWSSSGHLGIDPVKLEQIDPLEPEPLEAALDLSAEVFGPAVLAPLVGPGPPEAGLGRDDQALADTDIAPRR